MTSVDEYFTTDKVKDLTTNHNWEMVTAGDCKFVLRQKDDHAMKTVEFHATDETARFCKDRG